MWCATADCLWKWLLSLWITSVFPLDSLLILREFKRITNNQQIIKNYITYYPILGNKPMSLLTICLNIINMNSQAFKLPHCIQHWPMTTLYLSCMEEVHSSSSCQPWGPASWNPAGHTAGRSCVFVTDSRT